MPTCPTCNQPYASLATQLNLADKWWMLDDLAKGQSHFISDLGKVEMVSPPLPAEYDSYGATTGGPVFMVVKIGDRFFRKEGYRSSYDGTEWDGPCREVQGKPRTITVYDFVEEN